MRDIRDGVLKKKKETALLFLHVADSADSADSRRGQLVSSTRLYCFIGRSGFHVLNRVPCATAARACSTASPAWRWGTPRCRAAQRARAHVARPAVVRRVSPLHSQPTYPASAQTNPGSYSWPWVCHCVPPVSLAASVASEYWCMSTRQRCAASPKNKKGSGRRSRRRGRSTEIGFPD